MVQYFNAEAEENLEERYDDFVRGIPERFEELIKEVRSLERVEISDGRVGMLQNMVDGKTYGFLETREDPFPEMVLDFGRYEKDDQALVGTFYVELEHVQDTARLVRVGENDSPYPLVEFRQYMMADDGWESEVVDMDEIDLDAYAPFH